MRDCAAVREGMSAYLDGDFGADTRQDIEAHLDGCAACYATVQRARMAREMLRHVRRIQVSSEFDVRLRDRIRRKLEGRPWWHLPTLPGLKAMTARPVIGAAVGLAMLATVVAYSGRDEESTDTTFRAPGIPSRQLLPSTGGAADPAPDRGGGLVTVGQRDSIGQRAPSVPPRGPNRVQYVGQANQ